ncbi:MAG: 3-oxoadipate CoA-transferase [Deltaproteobacteria bacterium RBG_19FT_COMBO_46_12]|nr:MAG: 3-oxoadipate CoA-transferase [Deltaproteobacteria bacterium RBG_19FT_COMBO_46_12]
MKEAVSRFIEDGDSIVMGAALEAAIPFAVGHEIIRQRKKDLTLVGPISDMLFDQIIGSGCVKKVAAAWVGNVIMGVGYNMRRAVEGGVPRKIEVEDYTNFTISLALYAGGLGIPFIPTKSLLGTGMMTQGRLFKEMECPYTREKLALVPALKPDVTIVQVQRADEEGNAHFWGGSGVTKEAALAARKVIVVVEEIVSKKVIQRDPNRTLIPGFLVNAVVPEPWGAHPSPIQGYYNRDHEKYMTYHQDSKKREGYLKWLDTWVLGVKDRKEYLTLVGEEKIKSLLVKRHRKSHPVDYGY